MHSEFFHEILESPLLYYFDKFVCKQMTNFKENVS